MNLILSLNKDDLEFQKDRKTSNFIAVGFFKCMY